MEVLIVVWCLAGLAGWWWLLRRTPMGLGGRAPAGKWQASDAVLAGALALFFIYTFVASHGEPRPITPEIINRSIAFYSMMTALIAAAAFGRGQSPQAAFGLVPPRPLRILGFGILCIALTYPVVQFAEQIAANLGHPVTAGDEMVRYLRGELSRADLAWAIFLAVVVAPVTEELVFRGYLYGVLKKYGGQVVATLVTALLFAAVHQNIPAIPAYLILAIGFSLAYELTGSLWTSIVMHMIFNLVPVIVILRFPQWIP